MIVSLLNQISTLGTDEVVRQLESLSTSLEKPNTKISDIASRILLETQEEGAKFSLSNALLAVKADQRDRLVQIVKEIALKLNQDAITNILYSRGDLKETPRYCKRSRSR